MINNKNVYIPGKLQRRKFLKIAGQMALIAGCHLSSEHDSSVVSPILESYGFINMTLETKIGQMLLVGFRGLSVKNQADPIVQDIRDRQIGGILLFDYDVAQKRSVRNIKSSSQVKALIRALQAYSKIPLFVGIDYEGGGVNRLPQKYGFPPTVSHQYLGKKNNFALTHQYATQMARTLAQLGINLNFAPVVDVNINPRNPIIAQKERSFSANPFVVAKQALEFIRAHHRQNVLCTLKHFPGHGSSTADSHLGMVDITTTWSEIELIPYRKIIQAKEADAIMTAHVFNRRLDPLQPATLSKWTITHLLRQELGFEGLVFSDDIQMKAIASHYGLETAVYKAIDAGVDILIIGNNTGVFEPDIAAQVVTIIKELVLKGTLSETRIDESYQRILRFKQQKLFWNLRDNVL